MINTFFLLKNSTQFWNFPYTHTHKTIANQSYHAQKKKARKKSHVYIGKTLVFIKHTLVHIHVYSAGVGKRKYCTKEKAPSF